MTTKAVIPGFTTFILLVLLVAAFVAKAEPIAAVNPVPCPTVVPAATATPDGGPTYTPSPTHTPCIMKLMPTPPPTPCTDGDGIEYKVDVEPCVTSVEFSDNINGLGGNTEGNLFVFELTGEDPADLDDVARPESAC